MTTLALLFALTIGAYAVAVLEHWASTGRWHAAGPALSALFGFFGKALLFGATLDAGFLRLAVIAILNSVLVLVLVQVFLG